VTAGREVIRRLKTTDDVRGLVAWLVSVERDRPVVCVTTRHNETDPLVDIDALAGSVAEAADVYVLPTGDLTWELSSTLPDKLQVYGGATRIWWPGFTFADDPREHPLIFASDPADGPAVMSRVVRELRSRGHAVTEPAAEGVQVAADLAEAEVTGIVDALVYHGADLVLSDGRKAYSSVDRLVARRPGHPRDVLRVGQQVRGRVTGALRRDGRIEVDLRPSEPDGFSRVVDSYSVGAVVVGRVRTLREYGALVSIHPTFEAWLPLHALSDDPMDEPSDLLAPGQVIAAAITAIRPADRSVRLSVLAVPPGTEPLPALSQLPDGPPWIDVSTAQPIERQVTPVALASVADTDAAEAPVPETSSPPDAALAEATPAVDALRAELAAVADQSRADIEQVRSEADRLRHQFDAEIAQARARLLAMAAEATADVVGELRAAYEQAVAEVERLRDELRSVEQDRAAAIRDIQDRDERARAAERAARDLRKQVRKRDDRIASLEGAPSGAGTYADPDRQFRHEVELAWLRWPEADRDAYPPGAYTLGPDFLASLDRVEGVPRHRVVEVVTDVISRRAATMPSRQLHPLRVDSGGDSPQRERYDGARAWRVSLEQNTPSARRLHYWQLPNGTIELASIAYHDDIGIS
jgi:hypothetical protein